MCLIMELEMRSLLESLAQPSLGSSFSALWRERLREDPNKGFVID